MNYEKSNGIKTYSDLRDDFQILLNRCRNHGSKDTPRPIALPCRLQVAIILYFWHLVVSIDMSQHHHLGTASWYPLPHLRFLSRRLLLGHLGVAELDVIADSVTQEQQDCLRFQVSRGENDNNNNNTYFQKCSSPRKQPELEDWLVPSASCLHLKE